MFRFIRRVFIILILLIIIFFIFRLVKPEATNRFIDKVKVIPNTISSRFHREKKQKLIINGETTSTNSNFEINDNDEYYGDDYTTTTVNNDNYENTNKVYDQNNWEIKDTSRLDELNREIDKILASWNNQSWWEEIDTENNWNLGEIISELVDDNNTTWNGLPSWFVSIDVEQPYEPEQQNSTSSQNNSQNTTTNSQNTTNNTSNNNQSNSTPKEASTTTQQWWDCGSWLTVQDCEEFYNVFWSININTN